MAEEKTANREDILKGLQELVDAVQDGAAENQEKVEAELANIAKAVTRLDNIERRKMQADVGFCGDISTPEGQKALIEMPAQTDHARELQVLNDQLYLTNAMKAGKMEARESYFSAGGMKSLKLFKRWETLRDDFLKTMDTAESGYGAQWVPTGFSSELQSLIDVELRVAQNHRTIPMPQNPYTLPLKTGHATAYLASEQTDGASITKFERSKVPTANVTFTCVKPAARILWTGELDEDSIVPMYPVLSEEVALAIARGIENATINGQKTADIDTGYGGIAANDLRKGWDGFRYYSEQATATKVDASAMTIEALTGIRKAMGKTALEPTGLSWIPSLSAYYQLLNLKDSGSNPVVVPVYAFGAQATSKVGVLGFLQGIEVIPSEFVQDDLNATGIYDNITKTKTIIILDHHRSWNYGSTRELKVAASDQVYIESDILVIVATARLDFKNLFASTVQYGCGIGYNIAS